MKYLQYHQNEKLGLMGTLVPLMQSAAQTANMKVQSAMLDKLVGDYVKELNLIHRQARRVLLVSRCYW